MSWNLIRHELRQRKRGFISAAIITLLLLAMMLGKADTMIGNPGMTQLLDTMPKGLLDALGIRPDSFKTFEGFFASQAYTYIVLLLGCFAASWAITGIAKEKDRGTGEFLFSLPYTRSQVFLSKAAAHLLMSTLIFILVALLTFALGQSTTGIERPDGIVLLLVAGYMLCLAFSGIGYWLTTVLSSERAAMAIGIGMVIASFLLSMMTGAGGPLRRLADLSLFRLFDASEVALGGGLTAAGVLVTLAIYLAGLALGLVTLKRRDLT